MPTTTPWSMETAPRRLNHAFARIADDEVPIRYAFTETFEATKEADLQEAGSLSPNALSGALISIKDLLDVRGYHARAGSKIFDEEPAAQTDAPCVARLRASGALFVGHTNMTELAYGGLGLNPHYGNVENPLMPGRIVGGSTSGGAVSVATDLVDVAIGTDTGGSVRIPAAFTGLVGFKPSQSTVPLGGCRPLSPSLDSIGPIAKCVDHCATVWRALAGQLRSPETMAVPPLVIPKEFGLSDLAPAVADGFQVACSKLTAHDFQIKDRSFKELSTYGDFPVWHFSAVESRAAYSRQFTEKSALIDPFIFERMKWADGVSAIEYCKSLNWRQQLIRWSQRDLSDTFLLLPTVAILPPRFEELSDTENYFRLNALVLRNTTLANIIDGCSVSIPFHHENHTIGIMMIGANGTDEKMLQMASRVESILAR